MSSSLFALDQGQEVTLAPGAGLPHSPGHVSALLPSNDGLQGGSREALTIREPVPIPSIYSLKYEEILQYFAEKIANEGLDAATHLAAQYHKTKNPADAPTYGELKKRMEDAMANLGEKWDLFDQDRPSAMASRLLAPRAGQRYEFDEFESTWTNAKGRKFKGRKCQGPGCEYRGKDRKRHMDEQHVKDPVFALYCPYGCGQVYYRGRDSEMAHHLK